ncbi:Protein DOWNSTREAM OF FLC [Hibiscus syriacus]|uniref:Protein DOWNSTREAM OF FLC n=1 Tax=Hibiscus syriacus TaxID=106335 RepID=A0A6A3ASG1_HIBSY|nr:protein DOWNSTREAM OF FLC-like [Hibiscus syriacus]KAE8706848.1 Protein DOWNSTREAM OF FLC [Hibiscus syriacus]
MATKLFLLLAICVLPVLVNANRQPFKIIGKVYCDACRAGFETVKCSYIPGARVEIKCYDRITMKLKFSVGAETDATGTYSILVEDDHQDQICYATLVSSPIKSCAVPDTRRNKATVILTRSNGAVSHIHYANAMGFLQDTAAAGCAELLRSLLQDDE